MSLSLVLPFLVPSLIRPIRRLQINYGPLKLLHQNLDGGYWSPRLAMMTS